MKPKVRTIARVPMTFVEDRISPLELVAQRHADGKIILGIVGDTSFRNIVGEGAYTRHTNYVRARTGNGQSLETRLQKRAPSTFKRFLGRIGLH